MIQVSLEYWRAMFESFTEDFSAVLGGYVPKLLGALAVLLLGWILALAIAALVRGALRKTTLDNRLAAWALGEERAEGFDVERWTGKVVFYTLMLLVLVAFFQVLNLSLVAEPLNSLLNRLFEFLPRFFGAALLLLLAWVVASLLRRLVAAGLKTAKIDERFGEQTGVEIDERAPLAKSFSDAVYWLVLLLFLPAIFGALALEGILEPVQTMVTTVLGFLPNVFAAGLILFVGWFVARIIRRIVTSLLAASGVDRLGEKAGLAGVAGAQKISGILGLVLYVLVLIPVLIASLNALGLDAITQPASNMLNTVLDAIPSLFAATLVLVLAYAVGRVLSTLIANLLAGIGFDSLPVRLGLTKEVGQGERAPSAIVGFLVLVAVILFASIEAAGLIGFTSLSDLVTQFIAFAGHVILGLIIFGIGLYLAGLASKTILASGSPQSGILARVAQLSIVLLAAAVGLRQMGLANEIITLAFGLLLGAVAVSAALAFGLGGREIAQSHLSARIERMKSRRQEGPPASR